MLECCNCWVNKYDGPVSYECPPGEELAQILSEHSNHYEDRLWDFQCRNTGGAIAGIKSFHNNYYEDRVFDIKCCDVIKRTFQ
ncbi:millepora cytotoxin-1-like [Patella vulgata]|uniref:millepora cytotoxin-1-like n=1 Tax=Patella vulgata TaxID=6465 RepID=UPI00217F4706|nr:millepora cytotoxin-1-like [Patella vulgata]